VNVVVTDPLHVTWYGTWVTTPTLATNSGSSSTVEIKTEVLNNRSAAVNATLKTDIVDASGTVVTTISSQQQIAAGATVTFDQTTPAVSNPSLWHPDHPTMYKALSYLSDGTGTVDTFTTPFGFAGSAGRHRKDSPSTDRTTGSRRKRPSGPRRLGRRRGRLSSLPRRQDGQGGRDEFHPRLALSKAPAFADACDELGVLLWSENCFWGGFGGAAVALQRCVPKHLRRLRYVRCERPREFDGHDPHPSQSPSIIAWSMGNEDFFTGGPADRVVALLKSAVALTHKLDPHRQDDRAIGGAQSAIGARNPIPSATCRLQWRRHRVHQSRHAQRCV